jgi:hypothetical protein
MADLSLHQIELAGPEAWTVMGFLAGVAAVAQVKSLDGLVSARDFGELSLISYSIGPQLLPGNMGHGGSPAFSHPLHGLGGMLFAERTISVKLFWHLHFLSSLKLHYAG